MPRTVLGLPNKNLDLGVWQPAERSDLVTLLRARAAGPLAGEKQVTTFIRAMDEAAVFRHEPFAVDPFLVQNVAEEAALLEEEVVARAREFSLDILYARAKSNLWNKIAKLRGVPGLRVADFGTRRRHSFLHWRMKLPRAAVLWCSPKKNMACGAEISKNWTPPLFLLRPRPV